MNLNHLPVTNGIKRLNLMSYQLGENSVLYVLGLPFISEGFFKNMMKLPGVSNLPVLIRFILHLYTKMRLKTKIVLAVLPELKFT